jgi:hypothetical protein
VHGEGLPAGFYADNDVSGARLEVLGLLIGDAILLLDRGCENVAVPGVDGFGVERVQHIDGWVRGVPSRDDKDLRLECANTSIAIGIEVAMVVSDGDTDRAAYFGGGRFGVAPRVAAVVGVIGEIAAGVVAELSVAETNGAGAGILRGVVGRLERLPSSLPYQLRTCSGGCSSCGSKDVGLGARRSTESV